MGLLSANLKAAFQAGHTPIWLLSLALPGSTLRYAIPPYASAANGLYDARVLSWSGIPRSCDSSTGALENVEVTVTIEDKDQTFAQIVEGSSGSQVWNSVATIYVASRTVAVADWLSEFVGVLATFSKSAVGQWELTLRSNVAPLNVACPRTVINAQDWPNCSPDVLNQRAPIIYGNHDSSGTGLSGGAIPCLYVDTVGFRYMVCLGKALLVGAVFKDGTLVSSGYTTTYVTIRNRLYTLLDFTADQGTGVITCNVQGLDSTGDGTGTLITEPAAMLKHILHNWVFGDHPGTGAWYTSTAPIDATSFTVASSFFTARGYSAARYYGGGAGTITGASIIEEWAHTFEATSYWTGAGNIGVVAFDPSGFAYSNDPWFRWDNDQVGAGFALNYRDDLVLDRIVAGTTRMESNGKMAQTLEVRDPHSTANLPEAYDMVFTPSVVS